MLTINVQRIYVNIFCVFEHSFGCWNAECNLFHSIYSLIYYLNHMICTKIKNMN